MKTNILSRKPCMSHFVFPHFKTFLKSQISYDSFCVSAEENTITDLFVKMFVYVA